jgi:hypothetical protein
MRSIYIVTPPFLFFSDPFLGGFSVLEGEGPLLLCMYAHETGSSNFVSFRFISSVVQLQPASPHKAMTTMMIMILLLVFPFSAR